MFPFILVAIGGGIGYVVGRVTGGRAAAVAGVPGPIYTIRFTGITDAMTFQEILKALALKMGWKISDILDGRLDRATGNALVAFVTTVKNPPLPSAGTTFMVPESATTLAPVTVVDVIQAPASTSEVGPAVFS